LNLAVINLIPIPALDGGRLLFVLIEAVIRKPLPERIGHVLNTVGFIALVLLMAVVTYNDIVKLVQG
jgi:regulator of sigma E protease